MHNWFNAVGRLAGIGEDRSGHLEKWVSALGGLVGVGAVLLISQMELGLSAAAGLVGSMGASAVLLFAVPHGPLSQPWAVFGGHVISAVVGVSCAQAIQDPTVAAAAAVALAIGAMHYFRCIHPPGGATALSAVVGGDAVHQLGFQFVLTPVLLNAVTILLVALVFNAPFAWRRYPAALARSPTNGRGRVSNNGNPVEVRHE
ncbi:MAG: HPP family protein [Chromatiales bacterium]|nr:HPP family protein [Chromatiales bacterium]